MEYLSKQIQLHFVLLAMCYTGNSDIQSDSSVDPPSTTTTGSTSQDDASSSGHSGDVASSEFYIGTLQLSTYIRIWYNARKVANCSSSN